MVDPLSSAAAAFSLAEIAYQVLLRAFNSVSKFMAASAELRRLKCNLEELTKIITQIRDLSGAYKELDLTAETESLFHAIYEQLANFKRDVVDLNIIIDEPSSQCERRFNRFWWKLKWVFNERRIADLSSQLEQHKVTLQLGLLTILGKSGLTIQRSLLHVTEKVNYIRNSQVALQTQMARSVAGFDRQLSTIGQCVNTLDDLIRKLHQAQRRTVQNDWESTALLYGSARDGAAALEALYPDFYRALFPTGLAPTLSNPRNNSLWLRSQWYALIADLLGDEAQQLMQCLPNLSFFQPHNLSPAAPSYGDMSRAVQSNNPVCNLSKNTTPQPRLLGLSHLGPLYETTMIETTFSAGKLLITVKRALPEDGEISLKRPNTLCRIFFIPSQQSSLAGLAAEIIMQIDPIVKISRTISTFGIHSEDSPILRYLKERDISLVRDILSERKISPNDRDRSGNSLLWYAISRHYDYEMCRLLLNEGADVSDCTKSGDHALAVLLSKLPVIIHGNMRVAEDLLNLTRLLIKMSQCEAYSTLEYKRRSNNEHAQAGLLHCALRRENSNIRILEVIELILANEFDLEARDVNGNTPLLYALYYLPTFQLVEVVWTLIKWNADVKAVNKYGEGSLHLMLRRLSACNNFNMSSESAEAIIEILVALLEKGCDPTLGNMAASTPVDAALSPTAWPLFCRALKKVGRDMKSVILDLDDRDGIVQQDTEVEERFAEVISPRTWIAPYIGEYAQRHTDKPCYLCGGRNSLEVRRLPFDEFTSRVVDELGSGVHMGLCQHEHGDECHRVQDEDSSYFLDYHPSKMPKEALRNRSWRRHVAEMMWRKGILCTSLDCQEWAVGTGREEMI